MRKKTPPEKTRFSGDTERYKSLGNPDHPMNEQNGGNYDSPQDLGDLD